MFPIEVLKWISYRFIREEKTYYVAKNYLWFESRYLRFYWFFGLNWPFLLYLMYTFR